MGITGLEKAEARSEMGPTVRMVEGWEWRSEGHCVTPIPSLGKNGAKDEKTLNHQGGKAIPFPALSDLP